eukprot:scaffold10334_cov71-Phaeocystis_antarctica.AAC.11
MASMTLLASASWTVKETVLRATLLPFGPRTSAQCQAFPKTRASPRRAARMTAQSRASTQLT